ncbi:ribokinase [Crossiella sp. CA-258035]|uniref:ribokinase n=1 Tax=Crossiella sp. CA-258035 TaxID=2981138 RepID=UPI0024BCA7F3|nr:ribokinase [Crossiella sp. CA-258035]WHT19487.1 ribokinase [Crossiella sp. CA-258035]
MITSLTALTDIVVVGSANADLVTTVARRPAAGETVLGSDLRVSPGGKGANQAVAAARLGAGVAFLGAVGDDEHGQLLLESMRSAGVRTEHVRTPDRPTGIAHITVTPDGENSIVVSPGANGTLTTADIDRAASVIAISTVVLVSLEVPMPAALRAIELARAAGVRTVLNLSPPGPLTADALAALDPLIVNEHEAGWLLGAETTSADGPALAEALLALGPRSVVVTLGGRGAVVATPDCVSTVAAPRVSAVDTTGAGDAFAGALAARLSAGDELLAATGFAVRAAAISVTRPGAQPSYPTRGEVRA